MEPRPPPQRPISVTVIAAIAIAMGALGLMALLKTAVELLIGRAGVTGDLMNANSAFRIWTYISVPLSLALTSLLIAGGIGLLRLKKWARKAIIIWCISGMILAIPALAINLSIVPTMAQTMARNNMPQNIMRITLIATFVVSAAISLGMNIAFLIVLTRGNVKAVFNDASGVIPQALPASE